MVSSRAGRLIVIVKEADACRLIVHPSAIGWAISEAGAMEAIASLVDLGMMKKADAWRACVALAKATENDHSENDGQEE
jgi:hypothetical protein